MLTESKKGSQFASIEFFHRFAIALDRRRHERFQRIDNNGRRRMSANMLEVARSKTPSWPLVCCLLDQNNELGPIIAVPLLPVRSEIIAVHRVARARS
jgi:hypothetical protein